MESFGIYTDSLIAEVTGEDVNMTLLTEYQQFGGPIENATYETFKTLANGPSTGYQLSLRRFLTTIQRVSPTIISRQRILTMT